MKLSYKVCLCVLLALAFNTGISAQTTSFRDTLDGNVDASEFLKSVNGFIPLPQIITEPALGSFGLGITPVFIKPNHHAMPGQYVPPTVTAGLVGYSANNSWFAGAFRSQALPQYGLKYRIGALYASANIDLYRTLPLVGEKKFSFNFKVTPVFGTLIKKIGNTNLYAGIQYTFTHTEVTPQFEFDNLPEFIQDKSLKTVQSVPGVILEYDGRDNIFTPSNGTFVRAQYRMSADWTGSDFTYQNMEVNVLQYIQLSRYWVAGFRGQYQQQFGEAPFFLLLGVNMRGVPAARYQGTSVALLETEQRIDFNLRWSAVVFGGTAKAVAKNQTFESADWIYNYGTGFRYLLARQFGLRMGMDFAFSNSTNGSNNFGYYITFGSAW